jgi:hypothetical protein
MMTKEHSNTVLQLTNTDAAQSVVPSLCLLSVFAAEYHVGRARQASPGYPSVTSISFARCHIEVKR